MDNINEIAISIHKIIHSPLVIHSYNVISKFVNVTSVVMDKILVTLDKFIDKYGNSNLIMYKNHLESKTFIQELPWPKIILIFCISLLFIKIIQTAFSWVYKSMKFMMRSFIISVAISILIVWLLETSVEKFAIQEI